MDKPKTGVLLINKPVGPTSHDIIDKLRRITGIKKIGHAGTLDPFASGLLIVAIGREATREISKFVKLDKEYVATLRLGAISNTYDKTGEIVDCRFENKKLKIEKIKMTIEKFIGKQKQVPPMYSAKKVGGKRLYKLARQGKVIERVPEEIKIFKLELIDYRRPLLEILVKCSSGTYIRALADDIGKDLGCGAYLEELERTAIGDFKLNKAKEINQLNKNNWQQYLL